MGILPPKNVNNKNFNHKNYIHDFYEAGGTSFFLDKIKTIKNKNYHCFYRKQGWVTRNDAAS